LPARAKIARRGENVVVFYNKRGNFLRTLATLEPKAAISTSLFVNIPRTIAALRPQPNAAFA
jgi:hypothetical protein